MGSGVQSRPLMCARLARSIHKGASSGEGECVEYDQGRTGATAIRLVEGDRNGRCVENQGAGGLSGYTV